MSWSMIIFGFGFILGGCTGVLILGLVYLSGEQTAHSEYSGFGRRPRQGNTEPFTSPQLTVLNGRKAPAGLPSEKGNRILTTL
jgi:hypothetical protein